MADRLQAHICTTASSIVGAPPPRTPEGSQMGCSKWYHFGTPIPAPPLVCYGPLSVCRGQIGAPKGYQMEVQTGFKMSLKTMVPTKTS